MDEEVEDEGVIELEKETVLQYLSNLFGVLLLQLLLRAELLKRGRKAAVPSKQAHTFKTDNSGTHKAQQRTIPCSA